MKVVIRPKEDLTAEQQDILGWVVAGTFPIAEGEWTGEEWILHYNNDYSTEELEQELNSICEAGGIIVRRENTSTTQ